MRIGKVIVFAALVTAALFFGRGASVTYLSEPEEGALPVVFEIPPGASVADVSEELRASGLLDASLWFKWYGRLSGQAAEIQAGSFEVMPGMSISTLYELFRSASSAEREVTLLEGWTVQDIADFLEESSIDENIEELLSDPAWREEFEFLAELPTGLDLEGYVYPDTYRVFEDASAEDVLRKALQTFESRIALGRSEEVASSGRSLFDIVTIASMLEREVRGSDDMKMVADLIYRRLQIGMPLQFDSTVNYVTGKNDPGVLLIDRDTPSPYNTYVNRGLPIGPISNPSEQAIDAALNPTANPYLFFLTTPEGEVIYAETHEEHVQNKFRYLK